MPRTTHHPERTRTAGSHQQKPHRGRCPECDAPMPEGVRGSCRPCLNAPEATGWPALSVRTVAEAWSDYRIGGE